MKYHGFSVSYTRVGVLVVWPQGCTGVVLIGKVVQGLEVAVEMYPRHAYSFTFTDISPLLD